MAAFPKASGCCAEPLIRMHGSILYLVENEALEIASGNPAACETLPDQDYAVAFQGSLPICVDLKGEFHVALI